MADRRPGWKQGRVVNETGDHFLVELTHSGEGYVLRRDQFPGLDTRAGKRIWFKGDGPQIEQR